VTAIFVNPCSGTLRGRSGQQGNVIVCVACRSLSELSAQLLMRLPVQDGVILGADTRSTAGTTVADKNCEKIHFIADNIYCCGAGTAADTENVTAMVSSALKLHQYATGRKSRVITALTMLKQHLFSYQGHVSAALVLGGVDLNGPHIFTVCASLGMPKPAVAESALLLLLQLRMAVSIGANNHASLA
jgi:Proteasome subunit